MIPSNPFGYVWRPDRHPGKRRMMTFWNKTMSPPPDSFDLSSQYGVTVPDPMDDNDALGCCVMAARAKQELFFLLGEYGSQYGVQPYLPTDDQVIMQHVRDAFVLAGGKLEWLSSQRGLKVAERESPFDRLAEEAAIEFSNGK